MEQGTLNLIPPISACTLCLNICTKKENKVRERSPNGREMESYRVCCLFTRKFKAMEADMVSFVMEAFENYTDGGIRMNADQLRRFLGEEIAISYAQRILEEILHTKTLLYEDFQNYIFSNELNPPIKSQVHQDMNLPLSHYFIYTSHNSYLTGNQFTSSSSDVPIINALKRGVRAIELDLWPNSSKDNVVVANGRTLTTSVKLIRCLNSIKQYAFTASPYPLIITLEDHLTPNLRAKMAQMVTDTFGDMLFCHKSGKPKELPTPESLKYRILISTIPSNEYIEAEEECTESEGVYSCAYKNLPAFYIGNPKGGLDEAFKIEKDEVKHYSFSEQDCIEVADDHQQEIVRFTQKNIIRTYPKFTRLDSSNYDPLVGWLHGAQMIAFNMQGYDKRLWLMHGMFRANGGCGYVKKPDFLMSRGPNNEMFDPKAKLPVKTTLKLKIYMGDGWHLDFRKTHFSVFSPPDFYTKVGIFGAPADEIRKKTKVMMDTWTPVWNEEFEFPLTLPEIALLRIEVCEHDLSLKNVFAGQTCLPVFELMSGIHVVPLCNPKGYPYKGARLLMRFQFVSNN